MVRKPALIRAASHSLALLLALGAGGAAAQPDAEDKTLDRAGRIASQPVRDIGIAKDKIPDVLQTAVSDPYARPRTSRCSGMVAELKELNAALGPDFDADKAGNEDKATQLAEAGGSMLVNSLIPFRGVVREVSGAAAADRRKTIAINAGLARRGYLRGLASTRGCKVPVMPPPEAKQDEKDQKKDEKPN